MGDEVRYLIKIAAAFITGAVKQRIRHDTSVVDLIVHVGLPTWVIHMR